MANQFQDIGGYFAKKLKEKRDLEAGKTPDVEGDDPAQMALDSKRTPEEIARRKEALRQLKLERSGG